MKLDENVEVDAFIHLKGSSVDTLSSELVNSFHDLFESKPEFDAIICANGGFAMDSDDLADKLMEMNYNPVAAACSDQVLPYVTPDSGLFVAFGATAARGPPEHDEVSPMKKYIQSKRKVHYLVQALGSMTGKGLKKSKSHEVIQQRKIFHSLDELTAIAILPTTLDTAINRKAMNPSEEDLEDWTKLDEVAKQIVSWMEMEYLRPHSGGLIKCVTSKGETEFIISR